MKREGGKIENELFFKRESRRFEVGLKMFFLLGLLGNCWFFCCVVLVYGRIVVIEVVLVFLNKIVNNCVFNNLEMV